MPSFSHSCQSGAALVTALLLCVMLFGIAGSYLILSYGGHETSTRDLATVQARLAAEDGIQLGIAEIKSEIDADGDGLGSLTSTAADGRTIEVEATNLGGNLFRVHSSAADILYSSGVLSNLPPLGGPANVRIKSWCRAAVE